MTTNIDPIEKFDLNQLHWTPIQNEYLFCYAGKINDQLIYIHVYPSKTLFRKPACRITLNTGYTVLRTKVKHIDKESIHDAIYKLYEKAYHKSINYDLNILKRTLQ